MLDRNILIERCIAAMVIGGIGLWGLMIWLDHRKEVEIENQKAIEEVRIAINQNIVRSTAERLRMDPALLLAIARVESGFRSDVESSRGAKGVLQVRDATGAEIARYLGLEEWDLYNPEDCSLIGGAYLKDLLRMYQRDIHLALAAYHAGPLAVDEWVLQGNGLPGEQVIDTFAYRQTRHYVKSVLNIASDYRRHM